MSMRSHGLDVVGLGGEASEMWEKGRRDFEREGLKSATLMTERCIQGQIWQAAQLVRHLPQRHACSHANTAKVCYRAWWSELVLLGLVNSYGTTLARHQLFPAMFGVDSVGLLQRSPG
jgi:hypothetical protein